MKNFSFQMKSCFTYETLLSVPKIMKTAPSPTSENPPIFKGGENGRSKEKKEMESVL